MKFSRVLMPMVLAVAAAAGPIRAWAQTTAPAGAAPATDQALVQTITAPGTSQSERDAAARQLVNRKSATAKQGVSDILNGPTREESQLAVARALSGVPKPDPALVGPIFNLISPNAVLTDAAAAALADYHDSVDGQRDIAHDVFNQMVTRVSNVSAQESVRSALIRAMGSFVHNYSAQELTGLLQDVRNSAGIQDAACEALTDMTGLYVNDPDIQKWLQWWNAHKTMADKDFVSDLQANRSAAFAVQAARLRQAFGSGLGQTDSAAYDTFAKTYATDNADQKQRLLTDLLQNPAPDLRAIGAHIVYDEITKGTQPPAAIMAAFRPMIGDPATQVRYWVAVALESDPASFDLLLNQLTQETDDQVKGQIAHAIAPLGDKVLQAVGPIETLLDDPSYQVETDGALALAVMGPKLYDKDTALAARVSLKIASKLQALKEGPGTDNLRSALVRALAQLQGNKTQPDAVVLQAFNQALGPNQSTNVRLFAIQGIGNIGQANRADWIVPYLNDSDPSIRFEAATALGKLNVPSLYQKLVDVIHDDHADSTVHQAAWLSLQSWLGLMTESQLEHCAVALSDPEHPDRYLDEQLFAQEALAAMLEKSPPADDLAETWQQIGDLEMKIGNAAKPADTAKFADAARSYDRALSYWLSNGGHPETVTRLTDDKMGALLQSKQYAAATSLASDVLKDPTRQGDSRVVGGALANAAESLQSTNPDACRDLLEAIAKMNPSLPDIYAGRVAIVRQNLKQTSTAPATAPAAR